MKKFLLVFVLLFLVGCGGGSGSGSSLEIAQDLNPELEGVPQGTIAINFPNSDSKSLTNSEAEAESDAYEVVVYNSDTMVTGHSDTLTTELSVPVGEYKVIVLAGKKGIVDTWLLGTAMETGVVVTEGNRTDITPLLDAVTFNFSVPEEAICGQTYQITASGSTNTGVLELPTPPYIIVGADNTYNLMAYSQTGVSWEATIELTAPAIPSNELIKLKGHSIALNDPEENIDQTLSDLTYFNWQWVSYTTSEDSPGSPVYSEAIKTIMFTVTQTGIGVDVSWNS